MFTMLKNGTKYIPSASIGNIYTPYKVYGHFNSFSKEVFYNFVLRVSFHYSDDNDWVTNEERYFTIDATSIEKAIEELKNNLIYYLTNIENTSYFKSKNEFKFDQIKQVFIRMADGYYLGNNCYKKDEVDSPYKAVFTKAKNFEAKKEFIEYSFFTKFTYHRANGGWENENWNALKTETRTGYYSDTAPSLEDFKYQFDKEFFYIDKNIFSCYIEIDPNENIGTERT